MENKVFFIIILPDIDNNDTDDIIRLGAWAKGVERLVYINGGENCGGEVGLRSGGGGVLKVWRGKEVEVLVGCQSKGVWRERLR